MNHELTEFVERLGRCRSQLQASHLFRALLERFGARCFTYVNLSRRYPAPVYETTYPLDWIHHYETAGYVKSDLVILQGRRSLVPFRWDPQIMPTSPDQQRIFNEAGAWGIREGIAIPIHGIGADFAMVNIAAQDPDFGDLGGSSLHVLHVAALHYHALIEQLSGPNIPYIKLTAREREVLTWTAQGKTSWEISEILGISERTVVYHVESVKRKLGASTRQYAVVRAILYGLIEL